jgi:hypothetical protein
MRAPSVLAFQVNNSSKGIACLPPSLRSVLHTLNRASDAALATTA